MDVIAGKLVPDRGGDRGAALFNLLFFIEIRHEPPLEIPVLADRTPGDIEEDYSRDYQQQNDPAGKMEMGRENSLFLFERAFDWRVDYFKIPTVKGWFN